ncbi:MAG: S8 family serine peptidase [Clostridia bacterium]|nr:S8 family serine peptidase [Clostridia bacterium]
MIKKSLHIAVVDDGINEKFYSTGPFHYDIEITPELQVIERSGYDPYLTSHGTTCAGIIKKYFPNVVLSSIKILNKRALGVKDQLIKAIEWCCDNGIQLVNLSLGTIDYRDFDSIKHVVNGADKKGLIIVAACNNRNIISYPASLSNVIGVKCDKMDKLRQGEYVYNTPSYDNIEITSCSTHALKIFTGEVQTTSLCNSFAAPFVTALAARIMEACPGITLEGIKYELRGGALNRDECLAETNFYKNIDWVERGIVFSLSKSGIPSCKIEYCFEVVEEKKIKCTEVQDGLFDIWNFINGNEYLLSTADTVAVVVNDPELNPLVPEVEAFVESIAAIGKNVIFIDDNYNSNEIVKIEIEDIDRRILHSSIVSRCLNKCEKNAKQIDIPIIAIYDHTGKHFISIANQLTNQFKVDGYNVVPVTNSYIGVLGGIEFIPYKLNNMSKGFDVSRLTDIYNIYDPDSVIVAINALNKYDEHIENIRCELEFDIAIIIADDGVGVLNNTYERNDQAEVIYADYCSTSESFSCTRLGLTKYDDVAFASKLYDYIICLFESAR